MTSPVFSGFELPEDIRLMRDAVSRFVREQIVPAERALPPEARGFPEDVLKPLQARAREAGYWCFDAPAEYGGAGLSAFEIGRASCRERV